MSESVIDVAGHQVSVSKCDKVVFPDSGTTKGPLIDYDARSVPTALPHFRDRPLTMQRYPDGIAAAGSFHKVMPTYCPDWVDSVARDKKDGTVRYLVANDAATLVWLAHQACITPHLFLSRRNDPKHPDRVALDLDTSDGNPASVQRAAVALKRPLDELQRPSFAQAIGARGLHVAVPVEPRRDFDLTRQCARDLAAVVVARDPAAFTT